MTTAVFVAWRGGGDQTGHWGPVGRLERVAGGYRFVYTEGARKLRGFRPFPGMEDLEAVYESEELFPLFLNRLLAPSRPEYSAYLEWSGFDPDHPPDPVALLGITEGRRVTDQFEIFPYPQRDSKGCYQVKFFLHGIRWLPEPARKRIDRLQRDEQLGLLLDIHNPVDRSAVAVRTMTEHYLIGYVPRYLAEDVRSLCLRCDPEAMQLTVERVNADAPLQFRVLCRFRGCWPEGFAPCTGELYKPIPQTDSS